MTQDATSIVGYVDHQDRFVSGDATFAALNARAGGGAGMPLATPQLAAVVRLARRLAIPVSRPITLADVDVDLECWVRAKPTEDGVTITLLDIRERVPAPRVTPAISVAPPPGADWTWEADATLRIRRIDPDAVARQSLDLSTALGQPLTRVFALDASDGGTMPLLEAVAERRDFDGQRARLRDGTWVEIAGTARRDVAGSFLGFVGGVFADGSGDGSAVAAEGATFHLRLEEALRAPLTRIVAEADSMNAEVDGPLAPHYVDYAADIANAARHLLALVDDLADLNAIERPDFSVAADDIDLADVARRASGLLSVRAADTGVTIERPAPDFRLPASGEFRRTLQILVNLVGNAVRYSPCGASVVVTVEQDGKVARVHVADSGKGIAPEDQARIFEKFERIDPSEPGGSGLGLYIARRLARAMAGDLTVESESGQGACFTLSLPAR